MDFLFLAIGLLLVAVIVVAIGDRVGLPWPVLLTLVAAGTIFFPGLPRVHIPADLILPIFLPPLLWAMARRTSWSVIRRQRGTIIALSVLLVFFTTVAAAGAAMLVMPGLGLAAAVLLGSALAPPDPVAVDAVAEPAGVPRRLISTLQTEGLFNDAASIVAFHVALGAIQAGENLSIKAGVLDFLYSSSVAVIIGLGVGWVSAKLTDWMESPVARNAFSWVIPFAVFLLAEELHASGVIAIVIAAVEMHSRVKVGAEDRLTGHAFWETVEMLFTGVAFGLIGLSVREAVADVGSQLWHGVWVGAILSVVLIVVRLVWMLVLYNYNTRKLASLAGTVAEYASSKYIPVHAVGSAAGEITRKTIFPPMGAPLRLQEVLLLTWAGMRGLVTLALVLSIPYDYAPWQQEFTVIALVVLTITMVVPGLTLPWLMRKLSLDQGPDAFGDAARENLLRRAREAASVVLHAKAEELPPNTVASIQHWIAEETGTEDLDDTECAATRLAHKKKISDIRERASRIRYEALRAAQREVLEARREAGIDPAVADDVLHDIDRMILAIKRH